MKLGGRKYVKDCKCRGTSTKGAMCFEETVDKYGDAIRASVTIFPQPTCDECGTPWKDPNDTGAYLLVQVRHR